MFEVAGKREAAALGCLLHTTIHHVTRRMPMLAFGPDIL
jgi:hypothetical protein